jgi:hypothetical protein
MPTAAGVEGFVVAVKHEGPESSNCSSSVQRDLHVVLDESRGDPDPRHWIVTELTPREGPSLGPSSSWRDVMRGWTLYNARHAADRSSRGSAWEIHPIIALERRRDARTNLPIRG